MTIPHNENDLFGEPISVYTSDDAMEDGTLFYLFTINNDWEKGLFSHVTMGVMSKGYKTDEGLNIPNLYDLLNQCLAIVKKRSNNFTEQQDRFYEGMIELPSGEQQQVFICLNDHGYYTILLPEEY